MQKHVTIVGAVQIGYAAWGVLWAVLISIIMGLIVPSAGSQAGQAILSTVGCIIPGLLAALAVPGVVGGIGVLRLWPWARYLVLVLSVLALFSIPIGTAIGVYSIWVLIQDETAQLFAHGSDR
jgi:phage shock protein PspC (stress-responsive transcriptional regulator)